MTDWQFWLAAGVVTLMVVVLLLLALRGRQEADPAAEHDLQVYRDQLKEVERDLARGTIGADEADRLRAEVGRRVLEADRARGSEAESRSAPRQATIAAAMTIVLVGAGALWLYDRIGAPGYPDLPIAERIAASQKAMAARLNQAQYEAAAPKPDLPAPDPKFLELIAKLRQAVATRPDDLQGQQLLARSETKAGDFAAAWKAQAQVIRLLGAKATAEDYAWQAELMVLAAGWHVSPQADKPLATALRLDPADSRARFLTGLLYEQIGRPDLTFQLWEPLLQGPQDAPWIAPIRDQIETIAAAAGINYQLPPAPGTGPTGADVAEMAKLPPEQRAQMIRGMVEQLAGRLANGGGSVDEWARLIRAYGVLGETAKQQDALAKARAAFANSPADLAKLTAAAAPPAAGAAALPGPSAGDVAAAQTMSPQDRQTMIEGMVGKLAEKLDAEGGSPAEWARLITSYGVLGQTDKAKAAWVKAQAAFAGHADQLAPVKAAAERAGVAG